MKIAQVMTRSVKTCRPSDSLNTAAQLMWEADCGSVPVVNDEGVVVGFLTDRDICMAAYTQGGALHALRVESAMARKVISCRPEDPVSAVETLMRENQVRRLSVVDAYGKLVGIISLNDIAVEAERERSGGGKAEISDDEIGQTLGMICQHRGREVELPA